MFLLSSLRILKTEAIKVYYLPYVKIGLELYFPEVFRC